MKIDFHSKASLLIYTIEGKIELEELQKLRELQASISTGQKLNILAQVDSFEGFSSVEAGREAFLLDKGWLGIAQKYALLADQNWLRRVVALLGFFVPGIYFKTFKRNQKEEALHWLGANE